MARNSGKRENGVRSVKGREPGPTEIGMVPVASIKVGKQMVRVDAESDSIIELSTGIAQRGLLQPIGVHLLESGQYQLLWGARRLAAIRRLGHGEILAHVYDPGSMPVKALALVENLQREQMTIGEEVEAVRYLAEDEKKSINQISAMLSKGRSWVLSRLMIPDLGDHLRDALLDGDLNLGQVEDIAKFPDEGCQRYLAARAHNEKLPRRLIVSLGEAYMCSPAGEHSTLHVGTAETGQANAERYLYHCEACGASLALEQTRLFRMCKDGCKNLDDAPEAPGPERNERGKDVDRP